ncbi:hypothetical protein UFOVP1655_150 [uncultured Caudovirales phage]|uniref:Uncharacterized protein n=1 Tax=uncultured Caudovirales phage TaxID=2100421 RepID=A0A6J5T4W1_9CAUD|nr:hypothetical protein UFOVP1655_150 [uncultured Caudovirales phage]
MIENIIMKNGQIATITTKRAMKVKKGQPMVEKESTFQCRLGINYDNLSSVIVKRESGELPEENQGLRYGKWFKFPFLIEFKDELQLRCNSFKSSVPKETIYRVNGVEIDADEAKSYCLASEFRNTIGDVFNIKLSSIVRLA